MSHQPPGAYPPPYGYGPTPLPVPNGKATASLVTGITTLILSWCCGLGVVGLVAVVLGVKARAEIRASGGAQSGEGVATAGIVTGIVAVLLGLLVLALIGLALLAGFDFSTSSTYGTEF